VTTEDPHPNAEAHALMAAELAESNNARSLVDQPS
jgi:hypothetical protein